MTPAQADHVGRLIGQMIERVKAGQSKSETQWQLLYLRRLIDPPCNAKGEPDWDGAFMGLVDKDKRQA